MRSGAVGMFPGNGGSALAVFVCVPSRLWALVCVSVTVAIVADGEKTEIVQPRDRSDEVKLEKKSGV